MRRPLVLACVTVMSVMVGSASAQTPKGTKTSQGTKTSYGAWVVVCEKGKVCAMVQGALLQGKLFSQIQIGPYTNTGMLFRFHVPTNVWLPAGVELTTDQERITAKFSFCIPTGCYADSFVKSSVIDALGNLSNGKLQFKDATKRDIAVPITFNGFDAAYKALQQK